MWAVQILKRGIDKTRCKPMRNLAKNSNVTEACPTPCYLLNFWERLQRSKPALKTGQVTLFNFISQFPSFYNTTSLSLTPNLNPNPISNPEVGRQYPWEKTFLVTFSDPDFDWNIAWRKACTLCWFFSFFLFFIIEVFLSFNPRLTSGVVTNPLKKFSC